MMGERNSETIVAAELALAIYRSPAAHADWLRGNAPLPAGLTSLLRIAGGTDPGELEPALLGLAPAEELHKAAFFFVEQVQFRRDATHYRLLGLARNATPEQIKEHHRLLMRIFHPDRDSHLDERQEQFATRANLAYNTLRDADSRARYDKTLKPAAIRVQPGHRPPAGSMRRPSSQLESSWAMRVSPSVMRNLPQWVLAGTALVSLSIVGAVYLFNPPSAYLRQGGGMPVMESPRVDAGGSTYGASAEKLDEVAAQFERKIAEAQPAPLHAAEPEPPAAQVDQPQPGKQATMPAPVIAAKATAQLTTPRPAPPSATIDQTRPMPPAPVVVAPVAQAKPPAAQADQPQPGKQVTMPSPTIVAKANAQLAAPRPAPPSVMIDQVRPLPRTPMPLAPVVAAPVAQAKPPAVQADKPAQKLAADMPANTPDNQRLVLGQARPVSLPVAPPPAVEQARPAAVVADTQAAVAATPAPMPAQRPALPDLNSLLARFLEAYERGDIPACMSLLDEGMRAKQDLRKEYEALFRSTDLRHVKVQNVNWSRDGDSIRGEGQYRMTTMRKGETLIRTQSGQFRIELILRGSTALINDLQYIASGRS